MRNRLWTAAMLCLLASGSNAAKPCSKPSCDEVKTKIRILESKLRAGYTRAQGERYNARLRKLKQQRRKFCR